MPCAQFLRPPLAGPAAPIPRVVPRVVQPPSPHEELEDAFPLGCIVALQGYREGSQLACLNGVRGWVTDHVTADYKGYHGHMST